MRSTERLTKPVDVLESGKIDVRKLLVTKIQKALTVTVRSQSVPLSMDAFEGKIFPVQESCDLT